MRINKCLPASHHGAQIPIHPPFLNLQVQCSTPNVHRLVCVSKCIGHLTTNVNTVFELNTPNFATTSTRIHMKGMKMRNPPHSCAFLSL